MFEHVEIIEKCDWSYRDYLKELPLWNQRVKDNPKLKILFVGNHDYALTFGRGNQRGQNSLLEFDAESSSLLFPFYKIKRGGGLTFHYPGQVVLYPVMNLNKYRVSLKNLMAHLLESLKYTIDSFFPKVTVHWSWEPLGLWHQQKKLASIGMGLDRFITQHGIALNVFEDSKITEFLKFQGPCGLSGSSYSSLDQFVDVEELADKDFLARFQKSWTLKFLELSGG